MTCLSGANCKIVGRVDGNNHEYTPPAFTCRIMIGVPSSFHHTHAQEVLLGRDVDVLPREDDFQPLRSFSISAADKARINTYLQATTVALRCIAAGLEAAVMKVADMR